VGGEGGGYTPPDSCLSGSGKSERMGASCRRVASLHSDSLLLGLATNLVSMLHFEIIVLIHFPSVRCLHVCTIDDKKVLFPKKLFNLKLLCIFFIVIKNVISKFFSRPKDLNNCSIFLKIFSQFLSLSLQGSLQ
jgi:hypothetical protein